MDQKPIDFIGIDQLKLDPHNPRLPESLARDEQSMIDYIAETTAIEDLMGAIAENGFFPGEPVVAVKDPADERYLVVEGNRRLTAVLLLNNPSRCTRPSLRMQEISAHARNRPESIPVVVRDSRAEVLPYLGFRHITGVKQWEPLAKARYIRQLLDLTKADLPPSDRYQEVARMIGSRRDHIKRNLDALATYEVMKANDFYGIEGLDEESIKFAVLSTALADERIGEFVGAIHKTSDGPEPSHPVLNPSALDKGAVMELTEWLYKPDDKGRTRVGESRNLRQLAAVVDNPRALAAFREGASLRIAYQLTSDVGRDFAELLYQAEGALTEAASMVATVSYSDDAFQVSRRVMQTIQMIGKTLRDKRTPEDDIFS